MKKLLFSFLAVIFLISANAKAVSRASDEIQPDTMEVSMSGSPTFGSLGGTFNVVIHSKNEERLDGRIVAVQIPPCILPRPTKELDFAVQLGVGESNFYDFIVSDNQCAGEYIISVNFVKANGEILTCATHFTI